MIRTCRVYEQLCNMILPLPALLQHARLVYIVWLQGNVRITRNYVTNRMGTLDSFTRACAMFAARVSALTLNTRLAG